MMQPAEVRLGNDATSLRRLDLTRLRRVAVKTQMRALSLPKMPNWQLALPYCAEFRRRKKVAEGKWTPTAKMAFSVGTGIGFGWEGRIEGVGYVVGIFPRDCIKDVEVPR